MTLAPGVEFFEDKHEYWYKGGQLSGVTGLISKRLGIKMPDDIIEEHRVEGTHVHKAVQKWIETGDSGSVHPGVQWIVDTFKRDGKDVYSEVLVSDLKRYASAVDIITVKQDEVVIYDIKKGVFKRDYVTWQLSVYRYLIEKYTPLKVARCACICVKDRYYYPIFPKPAERVEMLLYGKAG